ncbi:hypothetical protein [Lutispora thermophila]|uniref:Uncharacterized protein n=1 Tax=Lutispora thermophila DSM 19022 TaxID=1122184 RepID=A0A1M6EUF1_9FIRM|nr:hypothetical protein [Lutispora thermophila]SHI88999.1 hypothetical protein SAMN02745176_01700 [Lutispora thermophila DSM 19022]
MKKRLISILLVVAMLFTQLPVEVIADVGSQYNTANNKVQDKEIFKNPFDDVQDGSW